MVSYTADPDQRAELEQLVGDDPGLSSLSRAGFLPNRSLLDLLEHPRCALPFEVYLDLLPPLRPRYYSISSSPRVDEGLQHHHRRSAGTGPLGQWRVRRHLLQSPRDQPSQQHGIRVRA